MRIGIVMPAFDVAPYIADAIRSVLAQTHQSWILTIVDDGSADATAAIAAGFTDPRIHLIRQPNAGVSAARNRGIVATDADAVVFLDADDWLAPDALCVLSAALLATPGAIAAIGSYRRVPNGTIHRPRAGDLLEPLLVRNLFANGGHLLIRRQFLEATGPFNANLSYGEDWEYWTRLARLGLFAAATSRTPLLFVRERPGSAYLGMAAHPESFAPCMNAIFSASELMSRFTPAALAQLRRRADAENDWVVGRELIRHGKVAMGRSFLHRSVRAAPSIKRLALLAAAWLPPPRIAPFRSYPVPEPV